MSFQRGSHSTWFTVADKIQHTNSPHQERGGKPLLEKPPRDAQALPAGSPWPAHAAMILTALWANSGARHVHGSAHLQGRGPLGLPGQKGDPSASSWGCEDFQATLGPWVTTSGSLGSSGAAQ